MWMDALGQRDYVFCPPKAVSQMLVSGRQGRYSGRRTSTRFPIGVPK
jgi:hypothetical protein